MCVIVLTDGRLYATVYRQSERAFGGSEGSGGAGSSCEPSWGGLLGRVFLGWRRVFLGWRVLALDVLWFVSVSVVVGSWHARVSGVWWWTREVRRA